MDEVDKGIDDGPFTRAQLDAKYGRGRRRPMRRFVIYQFHNAKWRAIDDGHHSGHNDASPCQRRVHTVRVELPVAAARAFWEHRVRLQARASQLGLPLHLEGGVDDESSAYRWKPVAPLRRMPFYMRLLELRIQGG